MRTWHEDLLETRVWRPEAAHLLGKPETVPRACRPPDGCGMSRLRLQVSRGAPSRGLHASLSAASGTGQSAGQARGAVSWSILSPGRSRPSEPWRFPDLDVLGALCQVQVLKVGGCSMGFRFLASGKEVSIFTFLQTD